MGDLGGDLSTRTPTSAHASNTASNRTGPRPSATSRLNRGTTSGPSRRRPLRGLDVEDARNQSATSEGAQTHGGCGSLAVSRFATSPQSRGRT